jgi:hypothetical protein
MLNVELVKADALRRLRPYLKQAPSWFQRGAKAKRDDAFRAYLAEIAQAHLTALMDGQVLPSTEALGSWFDGVLSDAVENACGHADVAARLSDYERARAVALIATPEASARDRCLWLARMQCRAVGLVNKHWQLILMLGGLSHRRGELRREEILALGPSRPIPASGGTIARCD